jgi:rubrerythrin
MKPAKDLTNLEVLEIAIKAEIHAAEMYRKMIDMVKNRDLKAKLQFLENEEKSHRALFEREYKAKFPDVDLDLPKESMVPSVEEALHKDLSLKELFEIAMEAERMSEKFYGELAEVSSDLQATATYKYLARVEHGHYDLLKNELEYIKQFPEYHQSEYFGFDDDAYHVGP